MSKEDRYFTAPLAILRSGKSAIDALEAALCYGIVNAGLGYLAKHGEDEFETLLEQADEAAEEQNLPTKPPPRLTLKDCDGKPIAHERSVEIWKAAHAGWKIIGLSGGNRAGDAQKWASHHREGQVFFKIKSEWFWNAMHTARREAGMDVEIDFKPLSWREFRILAAILSAPVKKFHGFVFLGWESIQARACGFHRKDLLAKNKEALPLHCHPLSRDQITRTTSRLEALKFYLRFRYSKGDRGGKTAYSFRHETREKLAESVGKYQAEYCFKPTVDANRSKDRELTIQLQRAASNLQHKEGVSLPAAWWAATTPASAPATIPAT